MTRKRFSKEKISIKNIGKQRFWIGVFAGIISAISISLAFNYTRETFRFLTGISADLLILKDYEFQTYNFFFSALAAVLGLSISIWIWMNNRQHRRKKDRIYKQLSMTYALLTFWSILMVIARFGTLFPILLYGMRGYDNQLDLLEEYWLLLILIPIIAFAQNWFSVRLVYRAGNWILISLPLCILTALILQLTTTVDQEILNNSYHQRFEKDYQYIDTEINKAKVAYGIEFDNKTIEVLKKWHTTSSIEQVMSLKAAFARRDPVTLDTLILEKIVIRNFKRGTWHYYKRNSLNNWQYALPHHILNQLRLINGETNQTKELFSILKEQINLINTQEIGWKEHQNYSDTELRRGSGTRYEIPERIFIQLKEVRDLLIKDDVYHKLAKELPEIEMKEANR